MSVGSSAQIPEAAGTGHKTVRFHKFVADLEKSAAPFQAEPPYIFDKGPFLNEAASSSQTPLCNVVLDAVPDWIAGGKDMSRLHYKSCFFTMGGDESGVQFHRHNEGWNLVLAGAKRWFLYAPDRLPVPHYPANELPIRDWLLHYYGGLQRLAVQHRPAECIQTRGELMYVPEGWYHATVNLADTLAVASQRTRQELLNSHILTEEHRMWDTAKRL